MKPTAAASCGSFFREYNTVDNMLNPNSRPPLSYHLLRITLGFVYFHFGILKFFPDLSPAELLASQTIMRLTGGMLDASDALFILAIMEVAKVGPSDADSGRRLSPEVNKTAVHCGRWLLSSCGRESPVRMLESRQLRSLITTPFQRVGPGRSFSVEV